MIYLFPFRWLLPICKVIISSLKTFNQELGHAINHVVIKIDDGLRWKLEHFIYWVLSCSTSFLWNVTTPQKRCRCSRSVPPQGPSVHFRGRTHSARHCGRLPRQASRALRSERTCPRHSFVRSWGRAVLSPKMADLNWHTFAQRPRWWEGRSGTCSTKK